MNEAPADETDPATWHRRFAVEAFGQAWDLIDAGIDGTDGDALLGAVFASRHHWASVGGPEQLVVGDWLIAHAASLTGHASIAQHFAAIALARCEAEGWTDWRLASCHEGMARAATLAGDRAGRDRHLAAAEAVLATLDDPEDRAVIAEQLASIPPLDG